MFEQVPTAPNQSVGKTFRINRMSAILLSQDEVIKYFTCIYIYIKNDVYSLFILYV